MLQKTRLAVIVAIACTYQSTAAAEENTTQLDTISVIENGNSALVNSTVTRKAIERKQPRDLKDLLSDQPDAGVSNLQSARSGNEGVNIRGLQGNRVAATVDGIPLPEAQESKHFISYGMEYGRGDYVEPTSLRSAEILYGGSSQSLSGSVNFATLEPDDLLKNRNFGGFIGTGYDSADHSVYGTLGGALQAGAYQGMVMTTLRNGHETETHGSNAGTGDARTEADPADYKNIYVLTKHHYRFDDHHKLKFTYEHQHKNTNRDLLSKNGLLIDQRTGTQLTGGSKDTVKRNRFSLGHEYNNENGWLQSAKTHVYFQSALTANDRIRNSPASYRHETSESKTKTFGLSSDLVSYIDGAAPQSLRYGFGYNQADISSYLYLDRPSYNAVQNRKPSADTTQKKFTLYIEDEIAWGSFVITPHLGLLHYRSNPSMDGDYSQAGARNVEVKKQKETEFTPKVALVWKVAPAFEPYFQYSRGVRTPSSQQLTSSFGEVVAFGGRTIEVAVVGNPDLKTETADNFELGFKGDSDTFRYRVTGYYNRYKNFIDWQDITRSMTGYTQFLQYQNLDKAKIYGVTAEATWHFYGDFYTNAGLAYARGKAKDNGVKTPINSVQPLKTRLGVGYDNDSYGATLQWTYVRAKADKDINSDMYNPTGGYSVFDLGVYWKPVKDLTLTANINNLFDKKYWNWNDISYLALLNGDVNTAGNPPIGIDALNADRYSAPGRNFNVGVRYEF